MKKVLAAFRTMAELWSCATGQHAPVDWVIMRDGDGQYFRAGHCRCGEVLWDWHHWRNQRHHGRGKTA